MRLERRAATPGQTVGPFFAYALPFAYDNELVPPTHLRAVRLHGSVRDGAGQPVPDALLELWQPDEQGRVVQQEGSLRRDGWSFTGFGRCATDDNGSFVFSTLRPGPTETGRAAFFLVTVFARGLPNRLFTRAYLPEDADALAAEPLLASLAPDDRATLVARADDAGYRFDVVLQGADETVFLRYPGH